MSAEDPVSAVELAALVRRYLHDHHYTRSYVTFTAESQHLLTTLQSPNMVRLAAARPRPPAQEALRVGMRCSGRILARSYALRRPLTRGSLS